MNKNPFVGVWRCEDDDCTTRIAVTERSGGIHVVVYDHSDGEYFKVSNIKLTRVSLSFECFVPSTCYRTKHYLTIDRMGTMAHRLTIFESWVRVKNSRKR